MNIIVPLGGLGTRFSKEGYSRPKPFVRVQGKEMILWLLESLTMGADDKLIIVYDPGHENMRDLMEGIVRGWFPSCNLVELPGPTRGAAETVLFGLKSLLRSDLERPCMLLDGDAFYSVDVVSMYRKWCASHNATFCFEDVGVKPIYSYVEVRNDTSRDVVNIVEKVKISDYANSGCYCFRSGAELKSFCCSIIERNVMQLSQDRQGEFYTSGVIKEMLEKQIPCKMILLNKDDIHVLGTPIQLKAFCGKSQYSPAVHACFTFEGVLCRCANLSSDEGGPHLHSRRLMESDISGWLPISKNIAYLRLLLGQGGAISIVTSMPNTISGQLMKWLDEHELFQVRVHYGAPTADILFSGNCVSVHDCMDLQKEVGYYETDKTEKKIINSHGASIPRFTVHEWFRPSHDLLLGIGIGAGALIMFCYFTKGVRRNDI